MDEQHRDQSKLKSLFDAARRADRAEAPGFDQLRAMPPRRRRALSGPALAVGATLAAAATLAAVGFFLPVRSPEALAKRTVASHVPGTEARDSSVPAKATVAPVATSTRSAAPGPDNQGVDKDANQPGNEARDVEPEVPIAKVSSSVTGAAEIDRTEQAKKKTWTDPADAQAVAATAPPAPPPPPVSKSTVIRSRLATDASTSAHPSGETRHNIPSSPRRTVVEEFAITVPAAADIPVDELDESLKEQLSSLGYVSGGEKPAPGEFRTYVVPARGIDPRTGAYAEAQKKLEEYARQLAETAEPEPSTEAYDHVVERRFVSPEHDPLSTFSVDVDTASYANVRRFLEQGKLPPRDAVRIEEMLNYFEYDYPEPVGADPFSISLEVADCPWNAEHRLARVGIRARGLQGPRPPANLVFLLDVSGSMREPEKLPMVQEAMALLTERLTGNDRVAIVTYAGASGLALPSTPGSATADILDAIEALQAGGSTNGGGGLILAYAIARENLVPGGVNRILMATDGDFNLGQTTRGELLNIVTAGAGDGIALTMLGVGTGNYKDGMLELLADRGDGNYYYLDSADEARKVLVEQIDGTLVTVARDVKLQVEFNPAEVGAYRLIGYENRALAKQDFNDDAKDAGDVGAGHTVTALYEIVPPAAAAGQPDVDALKYQKPGAPTEKAGTGELFTVKLRYKQPDEKQSRLLSAVAIDDGRDLRAATADFRLAAAVAEFGLVLRDSEHKAGADLQRAADLARSAPDKAGRGNALVDLIDRAIRLQK